MNLAALASAIAIIVLPAAAFGFLMYRIGRDVSATVEYIRGLRAGARLERMARMRAAKAVNTHATLKTAPGIRPLEHKEFVDNEADLRHRSIMRSINDASDEVAREELKHVSLNEIVNVVDDKKKTTTGIVKRAPYRSKSGKFCVDLEDPKSGLVRAYDVSRVRRL